MRSAIIRGRRSLVTDFTSSNELNNLHKLFNSRQELYLKAGQMNMRGLKVL
jgi:hypothetical protein